MRARARRGALLALVFAGLGAASLRTVPEVPPADLQVVTKAVAEEEPREAAPPACVPAPLEERAGAVLVVGLPGATQSSDPTVSSVLDAKVGGVMVSGPNIESSAQIGRFVSDVRARAGRPIVVTTDEESGRVSDFREVFGRTPSARRLAATMSAEAVQQFAQQTGSKLAAVGVDLDLAPVADLDAGKASGSIGDRSFSADPARAATYARAYALGLAAANVRPTAKHFPGHGTADDSHLGLPLVDKPLEQLQTTDVAPFVELVKAGVPVVMLNHIAYTALDKDLPASLSPKAYALLRSIGFTGVAITDSLGMGAINLRWSFPEAAVLAVMAGADAVLATDGSQARPMRDALVEAVRSGRLPEARLNEAAGRMRALAGNGDAAAFSCSTPALPPLAARR